jgi:hypothetical protein
MEANVKKIPLTIQEATQERILAHLRNQKLPMHYKFNIHFKAQFCYIDAYEDEDGETIPTHLCRLTYLGDIEQWSLAFYTYSGEKYQICIFPSGKWQGTPEEALEVGLIYLV